MSAYPLPDGRQITGALSMKFGRRARTGEWVEAPAAKYECFVCDTTEIVTGAATVAQFTRHIRTTHPATCPGHPTEGAQAA